MRAILTWHSVDASRSPISVTREEFRQQVRWLASGSVRVVSVEGLLELSDREPAVALTFDDGFANFATEAAPLLREHGFPVTVFVVTEHVGKDNRWNGKIDAGIPVLPLLNWDELARLREGGVAVAAHSTAHARLTQLDLPEVEAELCNAGKAIQRRLGGEFPHGLAYPYGAVDARVAAAATRWYRWAVTTQLRPLAGDDAPHRLPRLDAWYLRDPARLDGFGSGRFRAWLWCRRQARRLRGH